MSEGSLPPFKYLDPRRFPARIRGAVGSLIDRLRRDGGGKSRGPWNETATSDSLVDRSTAGSEDITSPVGRRINAGAPTSPSGHSAGDPSYAEIGAADRERAAAALRDFLKENVTNVERASRTRAQADRLEAEGIPSDSAQNRAIRAREEIVQELVRLRRSLHASGEPGAARALELEAGKLDPPISPEELRR